MDLNNTLEKKIQDIFTMLGQWRSQELSMEGALGNKYAGKGFFLISLVKNPFLSNTKLHWLGGCECPLAPPLATLLCWVKS
jgi:hypothetical protein